MTAELHLPDLPEVPVAVGAEPGGPRRPRLAWSERLRQAVGAYLPLLLMVALALLSWWLVKLAPGLPETRRASAPSHEPDYTLDGFHMQRFDASGRPTVQIEGQRLQHYPDTDELAIAAVHLRAIGADGRVTEATARQALVSGDTTEVRLEGDAHVVSQGTEPGSPPVDMQAQRLLVRVKVRQVSTDAPVRVRQGRAEFTADGLDYDDLAQRLELHGKVHAVWPPR